MPELTKEQLYILLGVMIIVLTGCVVGIFNQSIQEKQSSPKSSPTVLIDNMPKKEFSIPIYIHISGAVVREGVFRLNKGDRLIDLIRLAGASYDADLDAVNLSEGLSDGQKVSIPQKLSHITDTAPEAARTDKPVRSNKIVNINLADEKELDSLPGIGPAMAKKIIGHRKENGAFADIEGLKEVPGISEKKFDKLKKLISVH